MVENQMFVRVEHPRAGPVQMVAPPIRLGHGIGLYGAVALAASALGPEVAEPIANRFGARPLEAADLVARGALTEEMLRFLSACVQARLNVLISGGTGSGRSPSSRADSGSSELNLAAVTANMAGP